MTLSHNRVRAARGPELRCHGWRQESILRLLENNLENAEDQDSLVVYMSIAKAARDWDSFRRIVKALRRLEERDPRRAVRQADRNFPDARERAARRHGQRQPGRPLVIQRAC
jgi:hypothetical protein